jgi:hypothetical protein
MTRRLLIPMLALVTSTMACAEQGYWSSNGPFGGDIYRLAVDPGVSGRMYATARGGFFRKAASNQIWKQASEGFLSPPLIDGPLVLDREGNETLYMFDAAQRLYRSGIITDPYAPPGQQTRMVWTPTGYVLPSQYAPLELVETAVADGTLFLALSHRTQNPTPTGAALLLRSTDRGASFAPVGGIPADRLVRAVATDPLNPNHVLAGLQGYTMSTPGPEEPSIWESTNGGTTFSPAYSGAATMTTFTPTISDIAFGTGGRVFALIGNKIYVNDANGALGGWKETSAVLNSTNSGTLRPCARNEYLMPHPTDATLMYSIGTGITRWSIPVGAAAPVTATPTSINDQLTANPTLAGEAPPHLGLPLVAQVCVLAPSLGYPGTPGSHLIAATLGAGLMRTASAASNLWSRSTINAGLGGVNVRAIAFNPADTTNVLAGLGDNFYGSPGIFGSIDNGQTWTEDFNTSLKASSVRFIGFDPTTVSGGTATSTVYAAGRTASTPPWTNDAGYRSAGIFRGGSGGATWTSLNGDLPFNPGSRDYLRTVRWITLDPRACGTPPYSPTGPLCATGVTGGLKRLYATADGFISETSSDPEFPGLVVQESTHRAVRSDDGGSTYTRIDLPGPGGMPRSVLVYDGTTFEEVLYRFVTPYLVMIDPNDGQNLFMPTFTSLADYDPGDAHSPEVESGMFFSADGGATWNTLNTGLPKQPGRVLPTQDILSAVMHPLTAQIMWVTTVGYAPESNELVEGGVYRTINGGLNWTKVSTGLPPRIDIRALILDPEDPDLQNASPDNVTLYAASAGTVVEPGAVYRSDDGGLNWRSISVGLPAASATALAVDPSDRRRLLAGTDFGVWEITQLPDADGDGLPDNAEGGLGSGGFDGNGDNLPDAAQRDVGSITISLRGQAGTGPEITSDVIQALSTPSIPGGCEQTEDVQSIPSINFGQDLTGSGVRRYFYPHGLWRIQTNDCTSAVIDITYHGADFVNEYGWSFRYFGPAVPGDDTTVAWHPFEVRAHLAAPSINKWRIHLDANQFGSYRTDADRILFIGGPACYDDRVLVNGFEDMENQRAACGSD